MMHARGALRYRPRQVADLSKFDVVYPLPGVGPVKSQVVLQRGLAGFRRLLIAHHVDVVANSESQNQAFLEELKRVAAFTHPGIPQLHTLEVENSHLVMLSEFCAGATLAEMSEACQTQGYSVPAGFSLRVAVEAALALDYAHAFVDPLGRSLPVVHGDLSDARLMVTYDGGLKLLGFGLPRTPSTKAAREYSFSSPEQRRSQPPDRRSDVFSLAAILHSLLTGLKFRYGEVLGDPRRPPSPADFPAASARNPEVPLEVDGVLSLALSPEPSRRYATALDFCHALQNAAAGKLWSTEQCGALVQQFFADRREQHRMQVENAETGSSTAVMPLAQVLKPAQQAAPVLDDEPLTSPPITAMPTQPRQARPGEVMEAAESSGPEGGALFDDAEVDARAGRREVTQEIAVRPSSPGAGDEEPPTGESFGRKPSRVLRVVVGLLVVVGVTGAALFVLQPALAQALVAKARARLGMTAAPTPVPVPEPVPAAPDAAVEVPAPAPPDAGVHNEPAPDAGVQKEPAAGKHDKKKKKPVKKRGR